MSVQLGAHWLAFLWSLKSGDQQKLQEAVQQAKGAGATVFELMPPLLNEMPAKETAAALKAGGITNAVMCHFYPNGAIGDPLGNDDQHDQASTAFSDVIDNVEELRKEDITIDLIVGPSCFVLGKDYEVVETTLRSRISKFYSQFTDRLRTMKIRVAIELLRDTEDKVIRTEDNASAILANLPADVYGLHFDTFHFRDRGYDIQPHLHHYLQHDFVRQTIFGLGYVESATQIARFVQPSVLQVVGQRLLRRNESFPQNLLL